MKPTLAECVTELKRERHFRARCYPRFIENGSLTQAKADLQMARLNQSIVELEALAAARENNEAPLLDLTGLMR